MNRKVKKSKTVLKPAKYNKIVMSKGCIKVIFKKVHFGFLYEQYSLKSILSVGLVSFFVT